MNKTELLLALERFRSENARHAHRARLFGRVDEVSVWDTATACYEVAISLAQDLEE